MKMAIKEIKLDQLKIHPKNVRKEYEGIEELAQSIKENGIMQNLTVVPDLKEVGKFFVVIGNRRLTAARQAGIKTAPCVVIDSMSEKDQITTMLTENMNRKDLKIYEESAAIQMCFLDLGVDMKEMEEKTGLSKSTINHRLNVAKLDEKVLKDKAKDEDFQLSLLDLYSLEKVESIDTRNKILKEATDSRDLANKARRAAKEELETKNEKEFVALCDKRGIKAAPPEAESDFYSGKWETVTRYYLDEKVPKQLKIGKEGELFYIARYGTFYIIKKAEKKKFTEQDLNEREKRKRKKELNAKYKAMFKDMGDFIKSIFEGKIQSAKETEKMDQMIWNLLICGSTWVDKNYITQTLLGKELYSESITEEERNLAKEKAEKLPVLYQKIAVVYWNMKDLNLMEWNNTYSESAGEKLDRLYDILAMFGFSYSDEESYKIASGEHELYEKK